MGSSETGGGVEGVLDSSVGSIVWVRRRNGSWWPGKVLGPEELSYSHLTSPRSGTPVKLLGREDASVDWYNLEKSKRVKSFRCGEFDDCIERAEAAQGMPPKKREKYARREDAILHALELESQVLEKKSGKLGCPNGRGKRFFDTATSSGFLDNGDGNQSSPRSNQICDEHEPSSHADKNLAENLTGDAVKEGNQLSGDDNNKYIVTRMKGLQDLGVCTVPPPRDELSGVSLRGKKGRYTYLTNDSGNYLNDSGIQSSLMDIPISNFEESGLAYPANLGEETISRSTEDTETDCSETDSPESDSEDDMTALSDGSASIELRPKYPLRTETNEEHGSISSNDHEALMFADESSQPFSNDLVSTSMAESKWQLKGRRNNRRLGKRSLYRIDAEASRGYMNLRNSSWKGRDSKADSKRSLRGHTQAPCHNIFDFDALTWNNSLATGEGFLEDSQEFVDPFVGIPNFRGSMILVEVDLKVEANNYRRDVPMVSLMSQFNGHAIIGHPIQTEVLESGSSENLLTGTEFYFSGSLESPPMLPRVWRTGRRTTNFRVPRPNISSALDSDSRQKTVLIDQDRKFSFGSEPMSIGQKANISRNRLSLHPLDGRSFRIPPKKVGMSSNPKIRSLSSIDSVNKHHNNSTISGTHDRSNRLMKTGYLRSTVACIPVNLVFSRLHEELGGRHP